MIIYITVFVVGAVAGIIFDRWFMNRGVKALKNQVNKI